MTLLSKAERDKLCASSSAIELRAFSHILAVEHQRDELVRLLEALVDIEGPQPGNVQWFKDVKNALAKVKEALR